jgi:hypothetical protein
MLFVPPRAFPGGEDYDQLGVVVELPHEVLGLDERGFRTSARYQDRDAA